MYTCDSYLLDAVEVVSALDLPESEFAAAVNAQAKLMSGVPSDEPLCFESETSIH